MRWSAPTPRGLLVIANWRDLKHPDSGGAEVVCERLAGTFVEQGWDVVLLTAAVAGEPSVELSPAGYRTVRRGSRFTVYPLALLWLLMHRRKVRAVIDSQNGIPFFSPLVVRPRTPVLLLLHHVHQDQFRLYFPPAVARVGQLLERQVSSLVYGRRTVLAVSPSSRNGARRRLGLRGDIVVIPPGTEAALATLPGLGTRSPTPRIVCVGRMVPHKRFTHLVEAMPEILGAVPDLELHLIGDGPERPHLARLADELGLSDRVVLHGALSSSHRDQLLRTAWLSVNVSEGEGWGLSVIEANALGVPVLAYRRPGLRDSIRHGETGWLIDEHDPLSEAVIGAIADLTDDASGLTLSDSARHWASKFTWDAMAEQLSAQLLAEEGRLAHSSDNRRLDTDVATVARIPVDVLTGGERPTFRTTDRCMVGETELVVLLRNTDLDSAATALKRAGLRPGLIEEGRVTLSVARPVDFICPTAATASPGDATAARLARDVLAG